MFFNTLSGRFSGLTILFVMIAEVLIFVPSVANFRRDYLQNRLELSQLAALALLATPEEAVPEDLESELLATADVLTSCSGATRSASSRSRRGPCRGWSRRRST